MGLFSRWKKKKSQQSFLENPKALFQAFEETKAKHGEETAKLRLMAAMYQQQLELQRKGCDTDEIPGGFGEFGFTVTNPIPVSGIDSSEKYLESLRTAQGERITWNRVGSCVSENIDNMIDCYAIASESGRDLGELYISPYHRRISQKAPKGFRIDT